MVKKGQSKGGKPGGGGGTKKPSPATTTGDDSFIVFSNSDKDPKPKRPATTSAGPSNLDGPDILGEAPKRPDVKKIIGGASWTGKLPVNMLSEHCQKQRWEKPEYTMVCAVLLILVSAKCI
jgi:ATP-dependent RNA helicase DHX57